MPLRSAASLAMLSALTVFAGCSPQDCQGAGFITPIAVVDTEDIPNITPLCLGNNTTVNGDVNITSQAQLDTLRNCVTVNGNITILGSTDIVDLTALATLETIAQGYFLAFNNAALTSVELPRLEVVAYGFGVIDNPAVTAVTVPAIETVLGDLTIRNNPALTNVAFPALKEIVTDSRGGPGNFIVAENPAFTGFQNFGLLTKIDGFFSVFANDALENFQGLELLNDINNTGNAAQALAVGIDFDAENNIVDAGNASLRDLSGLGDLETINGDIFIAFNPDMTSLAGLDDLRVHAKNIFIAGNDSLVNLAGLDGDGGNDGEDDGLQIVNGSIFIGMFFDRFKQPVGAGNAALQNLNGLDNLVQLDGSLVLTFNPQLQDLSGLDVLPAIGGDLVIAGSQLDSFEGALALTTIQGDLLLGQLFGNDDGVLRQPLDVNEALLDQNKTDIAIDLDPAGNGTDFDALATVNGDVVLAFANLGSLRLADTLTTIGGRLILHDTNLEDLTGLETVQTLGGLVVGLAVDKNGNFSAGGNNNLDAFTGLAVTALGAGGLAIGFNDNLPDLVTLPDFTNIAGDVTVVAQDFTSLEGLDVSTIGGDLNVGAIRNGNAAPIDAGLDQLTAIAMQEVTNIGGDVLIAFNDDLTDTAFPALVDVDGAFEITANGALVTIAGLNVLANVGDFRIHDLPELTTLTAQALGFVENDLFLVRNPNLTTVNFNGLNVVGNTFTLSQLDELVNLDFLANLNVVGNVAEGFGDFFLTDNDVLANIAGLNGLQAVGNDFVIARNASVDNLELASLNTVGGTFEVAQMNGLTDLQPLATGTQPLTTIGDALRIRQNANLETLHGLEAVQTIGLTLSIVGNPNLETILIDGGAADAVDVGDIGLVLLREVGNPNFDEEVPTGDRGVVEAQDNPLLDEEQVQDVINDLDGFEGNGGFTLLCGNIGSAVADCTPDVVAAAAGNEGEGEGEGEGE